MKELIKYEFGRFLVFVQSQKAAALTKSGMTISNDVKSTLKERLMRNFLLKKAERNRDFDTLAMFHKDYWINQGEAYFSRSQDNFRNLFLPDCVFIFDLLQKELAAGGDHFDTLVEIGTGNGEVLNYLATKFDQVDRFIGIDLSQEQTIANVQKYHANDRLEFVAADGYEWVKAHGRGNSIFVTSLGVLEYFTEHKLQAFFNSICGLGKIHFVAIEPNSVDHDFSQNPCSRPYGHESSFSHNYPELFTNAGLVLWHHSRKDYIERDHYFNFIGAGN